MSAAGSAITFRYFAEEEFSARNFHRSVTDIKRVGFAGYPAFKFEPGRTYADDVLETFARRMPPPSRTDFGKYLEYFSIRSSTELSILQLLALTEGRLPGDGFSLVDPLDPEMPDGDVVFEIAGYRHEAIDVVPDVGAQLRLVPEPENEWDPLAVAVYLNEKRVGFVNKIQAAAVGAWISRRDLECVVLRFNGRVGAPRAYALLRVGPAARQLAA